MPKAYSNDLQWRMVWTYLLQQEEIDGISSRLYVAEKIVRKILYLNLSTGYVSRSSDLVLSENCPIAKSCNYLT